MLFFALSTIPLIRRLPNNVTQEWYADDASACGEVSHLRLWWDQLSLLGPHFGYFPNASKTWLVVKEQYLNHAQLLFANTCVNVTTDGRPHLGAAIGSTAFVAQYVSNKITTWISELKLLSSFAITQPHAAYSAFTHGLVSKWLSVARTIPNVDDPFHPLEDCIRHSFIPAVTGHLPPCDLETFWLFPLGLAVWVLSTLSECVLLSLPPLTKLPSLCNSVFSNQHFLK